jgi:hypothetical protein
MTIRSRVLALGCILVLQGCCSSGGGEKKHSLPECGIAIELPTHFKAAPHKGGCAYQWNGEGATLLEVTGALPGDMGQEADANTAMPGQVVDYARAATFGEAYGAHPGFPGKERRTQQKVGQQNRAVWTGFFQGPKGGVNVKVSSIQQYDADEFGEQFWTALRTHRIRPLK